MKPIPGASLAQYRWAVTSRVAAAVFGGYALASAAAACLAVWLPMARPDAVITAMLLAFVIYAIGATWVFATRNAWRAWGGLLVPAAVLAAVYWLGRPVGLA
ncbi:DUF3649 domain-containing protein [Bordetella petrii]|uniref:DUF3649 domain-containing protein n=1 Tax=Bordetella petrii TaxID=94624 RepID=UPI001E4E9D65|nr:DUF3649 domain-containing protein [Bordetella petrii]MCD0504778.1 DUF3649 domain-containing protein [Bordetella petrii]